MKRHVWFHSYIKCHMTNKHIQPVAVGPPVWMKWISDELQPEDVTWSRWSVPSRGTTSTLQFHTSVPSFHCSLTWKAHSRKYLPQNWMNWYHAHMLDSIDPTPRLKSTHSSTEPKIHYFTFTLDLLATYYMSYDLQVRSDCESRGFENTSLYSFHIKSTQTGASGNLHRDNSLCA